MTSQESIERPLRVGVFDHLEQADQAVAELLATGFTVDQITVICSEEAVQRHFKRFEHQDPAGTNTAGAALTGGAIGATLGGLATIASATVLGLPALLVAGGLALWTGGVAGGLVGAMMTRGVEKELANFYDQAVVRGQILVAAEQLDPTRQAMLKRASEIFAEHGVHPFPLVEG